MKVFYYTFGCKVNSFETSAAARLLEQSGYETADSLGGADVAVVNSCTVTANSDAKLRKLLRSIKRERPEIITVLCGCMPQAFPDEAAKLTEADIVTGNASRSMLPTLLDSFLRGGARIVDIPRHQSEIEPLAAPTHLGHTRAFLKIEDGCDRFCAYCAIPLARGPVRSLSPDEIARQTAKLVQNGYKEIVVSGINLSRYGTDMGLSLADGIEAAAGACGEARLRLGSLEPDLLSDDTLTRLSKINALCPQFHLALQSGCDATLKRMNRHYTAAGYRAVADKMRGLFDRPTFITDIMVGFPGESDEEFSESLEFVSGFGFLKCHVFPYSKREGTAAARMKNQVERVQKEQRAKKMTAAAERSRREVLEGFVGGKAVVIAETQNPDGSFSGYTERYAPAVISGEGIKKGDVVSGVVESIRDGVCFVREQG